MTRTTKAGYLFLLFLLNYIFRAVCRGKIHYGFSSSNGSQTQKILSHCISTLTSWYFPNPLLSNAFVQSVAAEFVRPHAYGLCFHREFLATKYGATICLSWADLGSSTPKLDNDKPVLFVLPGTNGDENGSWYLQLMCKHALLAGMHVVVYVRRGCGLPMSNGRPQDYSDPLKGPESSDMDLALSLVRDRHPRSKFCAVGYSLGGNFLANYLGNGHTHSVQFQSAVCVCSPYDITGLSYWIEHRYKMVDWFLRKTMRLNRSVIESDTEAMQRGIDVDKICLAKSFRRQCELDNLRIWGLPNETLNRYLDRCSCYNQLEKINTPTLFVNSLDDPVAHDLFIPYERLLANPNLVLVTTKTGGHHAFLDAWLFSGETHLPHCDHLALEWIKSSLLE